MFETRPGIGQTSSLRKNCVLFVKISKSNCRVFAVAEWPCPAPKKIRCRLFMLFYMAITQRLPFMLGLQMEVLLV